MFQKTIKTAVQCSGVGLHSGETVNLTLRPANIGTGIVFNRTDVTDKNPVIKAVWYNVVDTRMCTVIGNDHGVTVGTIEHIMSALQGCQIDNLIIDIDNIEVPIMDGSAEPFAFLIDCAGTEEQDALRSVIKIIDEVRVDENGKTAIFSPAGNTSYQFDIDFDHCAIGQQTRDLKLVNGCFRSDIARARTFGFVHEVEAMRAAGLARGGSLDNAIVLDEKTILNKTGLRYDDEFVRHKILDAIGDLYLAGMPIIGHYHGIKAGHDMNNKLLQALFANPNSFVIVEEATQIAQNQPDSIAVNLGV